MKHSELNTPVFNSSTPCTLMKLFSAIFLYFMHKEQPQNFLIHYLHILQLIPVLLLFRTEET